MLFSKSNQRKKNFQDKKIILVETFFSKNLVSKNNFIERYNKEAYLKFPKSLKRDSYFFPINLSILKIRSNLENIKNEKIKFIHPLDFLELSDYIESIFLIPSLGKIKNKPINFKNYEITNIVKSYNFYSYFNYSTFLSNLNYNFLRRLRNNRTNVNFILDWYENQIIDKGVSMGKNQFFESSKIKGHMGFINDFENIHYYYPTELEKKLKCIPDEILLLNKNKLKKFKKNKKLTNYKIVPSSRNQQIFNLRPKINKKFINKNIILFILSANQEESEFIYKIIQEIYYKINHKKLEIRLKAHPNSKISPFIKKAKNILIADQSIYKEILNAAIVVGGGTTATIEAQILNKNIILVGNNSEIMLNPLMNSNKKFVKTCFDSTSLIKNIQLYLKAKPRKNHLNKKLLNSYFIKFEKNLNKNFYN